MNFLFGTKDKDKTPAQTQSAPAPSSCVAPTTAENHIVIKGHNKNPHHLHNHGHMDLKLPDNLFIMTEVS